MQASRLTCVVSRPRHSLKAMQMRGPASGGAWQISLADEGPGEPAQHARSPLTSVYSMDRHHFIGHYHLFPETVCTSHFLFSAFFLGPFAEREKSARQRREKMERSNEHFYLFPFVTSSVCRLCSILFRIKHSSSKERSLATTVVRRIASLISCVVPFIYVFFFKFP